MRTITRLLSLPLLVCLLSSSLLLSTASCHNNQVLHDPQRRASHAHLRPPHNHHHQDRRREQQLSSPPDPPKIIQSYTLWNSQQIHETLNVWSKHYVNLINVSTSQDTFGLPTAGGPNDCPFDDAQDGCLNYFFIIQDYVAHPEGSESAKRLPSVLLSGEVHGDEQVGPTAVLEAAQLLLDAASCEALPRMALRDTPEWDNDVINAKACRQNFSDMGITDSNRQWLARLVTTRKIVVVPTANALGYYRTVREENGVDPNRDFPYDLRDPRSCMVTIAGRTLNEIFRQNMFQLSLTFHGGMEVIGYEWGAPSWGGKTSPDDIAEGEIAAAYSHYGGGWSGSRPYQYGNMNDLVYPVRGGMEDWAYAGSWDTERVIQCQPTTFGGYPAEKTTYNPSTLRVFNMLVESSDQKIPPAKSLGTSEEVLQSTSTGTGYVSRNMRLSLLAIELVEPYVKFTEVNELTLSEDVVPLTARGGRTCQTNKTVGVPYNSLRTVLQWTVGGAMTIDNTQLWFGRWDDIPETVLDCLSQPNLDDLKKYTKNGTIMTASSGTGQFSSAGASPPFAGSIDISNFQEGDRIVVVASARVDQSWSQKPGGNVGPDVPPQSHIVNARTNQSWYHESAGMIVQGRLDWFSIPLTIVLEKRMPTNTDADVIAVELSDRFANYTFAMANTATESTSPSTTAASPKTKTATVTGVTALIILAVGAVLLGFAGRAYMRHRMRVARRTQVREFIEDETAPSPGLRHKVNKSKGYSGLDTGEVEMGEMT